MPKSSTPSGLLTLSHRRKGFDLALEVLCSLSPRPKRVLDLARSFQIDPGEIRKLVATLRKRGYEVRLGTSLQAAALTGRIMGTGWWVWVDRLGWAETKQAAQDYWTQMYRGSS